MSYKVLGNIIISDARNLIGVNTAGINTALYVGDGANLITLDGLSGNVNAVTYTGDGSRLTGIVTSGGDADINGGFNVSGIATFGNGIVVNGGISTFNNNLDLNNNDLINVGKGNFSELDVSGHIEGDTLQISGISTLSSLTFTGADADELVTGITTDLTESADAEELVTAAGVKAYVDGSVGAANQLTFGGDVGPDGEVELADEVLDVKGEANEIVTGVAVGLGNTLTVGLSTELQLPGSLAFSGGDADEVVSGITTDLVESAEADELVTAAGVKAYVDGSVGAANQLNFAGDTGAQGEIDLTSEVLDIQGATNEIVTDVAVGLGQTMSVGLSDTLVFPGSVAFNGGDADEVVSGITTNLGESAAADELVTAAGVVAYVSGQVSGNSNLTIQDDASGIGTIALGSENLVFKGTLNEVEVSVSGAPGEVTIGLPDSISIASSVTAVKYYGDGSELTNISAGNVDLDGTNQSFNTLTLTGPGIGLTVDNGIDVNGFADFNAGMAVVGVVTATDFNSTSDIRKKDNVVEIEDAVAKVQALRGVTFDWKDGSGSSGGIIAQEVEAVLPTLVKEGADHKTVIYNGLIGLLVQAVKEQQAQIDELKSKLD
jgi:hypothetical protein